MQQGRAEGAQVGAGAEVDSLPAGLEAQDAQRYGDLEGDEEAVGLDSAATEAHKRVAGVLNELAKTARSFLLYDPRNKAIHNFLTELLRNFKSCLAEYGDIHIDVQPFEMWYDGVCVYLNRDRERSMSFRLYRDGVRELTFNDGFDWEEMAKLLEVLSIRYTGVHQNEDDTVTLLWKANFQSLNMVAVEGYVPDDDELPERSSTPTAKRSDSDFTLPNEVDLPAPRFSESEDVRWVEVTPDLIEDMRRESGSGSLPNECVQLLMHLRQMIDIPSERLSLGEVSHIFQEVQGFLLSEEYLDFLLGYIELVEEMAKTATPEWDGSRQAVARGLLKGSGDPANVRRILRSITAERATVSDSLVAYLDKACPDPLTAVADVMANEHSQVVRKVGRQLLQLYGKDTPGRLQQRFRGASGHLAVDLLRSVSKVGGDRFASWIAEQTAHADQDVQEEALYQLRGLKYSGAVGKALSSTYKGADQSMREKLLGLMIETGDARFSMLLESVLQERGNKITPDEALLMGQAMGQLAKASGVPRWRETLTPKGWLRKQLPGSLAEQVAAASALSEMPGEESLEIMRTAMKAATTEANPWIGRCMVRHQKRTKEDAA